MFEPAVIASSWTVYGIVMPWPPPPAGAPFAGCWL